MPPLVNRLAFTMAPSQAPWFIRPFVRFILNGMITGYVEPEIQKHADLVSHPSQMSLLRSFLMMQPLRLPNFKVESHLSKNEWFAGGSGPTAADFSMAMVIEVFVLYGYAGPGINEYFKRVKAR
jgi:glutathione S-transferase